MVPKTLQERKMLYRSSQMGPSWLGHECPSSQCFFYLILGNLFKRRWKQSLGSSINFDT